MIKNLLKYKNKEKIIIYNSNNNKLNYKKKLYYVRVLKNKKYGLFNSKLEQIIPFKYTLISPLVINNKNILFKIKLNNKYGYIDSKNKVIIPIKYNNIHHLKNNIFYFQTNKKQGLLIKKKNNIKKIFYDNLFFISTTKIIVKKNNKFGVINLYNKKIINIKYDNIFYLSSIFLVKKNNKYALFNKNGKKITDFIFNSFYHLTHHYFCLSKNNFFGIFDSKKNNIIIPPIFKSFDYSGINLFHNEKILFFAERNNKTYLINEKGKIVNIFNIQKKYIYIKASLDNKYFILSIVNNENSEDILLDINGKIILSNFFFLTDKKKKDKQIIYFFKHPYKYIVEIKKNKTKIIKKKLIY